MEPIWDADTLLPYYTGVNSKAPSSNMVGKGLKNAVTFTAAAISKNNPYKKERGAGFTRAPH